MLIWNNPPRRLFASLGLSVVSQFSIANSGINKRNFETSNSKSGQGWDVAHFSSSIQREAHLWEAISVELRNSEFWDAQKRLLGSLYKFSTPVSSSFCKIGSQGVACNELERQMEWGHPLVGLERVQGTGQWFGHIHRAAARNLPHPSVSRRSLSSCSNLPQPLPNASPSHGPGPGPHQAWPAHSPHPSSNSITAKFPKLGFRQQSW